MIEEARLAYLAGFVDGEGTITLARSSNKRAFRVPHLCVSSTDEYLLSPFIEEFGGAIQPKGRERASSHRQGFEYRLKNDAAIEAIRRMFPYLRHHEKRLRAKMLIEEYKLITVRNGRYTDNQRLIKEAFEDRFLGLTNRGVSGSLAA